jgi:hypothetical protein
MAFDGRASGLRFSKGLPMADAPQQPNSNWHKDAKVLSGPKDLQRPLVDLSEWSYRVLKPQDETRTGIIEKHYNVFRAVAKAENCIIVVRQTKAACLPWIKMNFPAKPSVISKSKTDPVTGIVTCSHSHEEHSYAEQIKEAWASGHYVLHLEPREKPPEASGGLGVFGGYNPHGLAMANRHAEDLAYGPPMRLVARCYHHTLDRIFPLNSDYAEGQVIDPQSGLPLTGDYDLMGVMPMDNPTGKNLVLIHNVNDKPMEKEKSIGAALLRKMRDNPYGKRISAKLNEGFGMARIQHGAHDLKFDPRVNSGKEEEGCAVFSPQLCFFLPTKSEVDDFYNKLGRLQQLPFRSEREWAQKKSEEKNKGAPSK